MDDILDIHLSLQIIGLCLVPSLSAVLLYLVTQHGFAATKLQEFRGVVAPFFVSVSTLFALFAAFLGADIWQRVQQSNHSLEREVAGVQSILQIAQSLGPIGDSILLEMRRYAHLTLVQELSKGSSERSAAADEALGATVQEILDLPGDNGPQNAARGAMLTAYESIWTARATRRNIAGTHSDPYQWAAVFFLGLLTQVALTLCHLEGRKALSAALFTFTLAFVATMIVLVIHERPIADPALVSVEHIERIVGPVARP